jgi:hypothetical protein
MMLNRCLPVIGTVAQGDNSATSKTNNDIFFIAIML